jgi:hypothetical protein
MINIQDYVSVPRTGKAGLRLASISSGISTLSLRPNQHSAPSFTDTDAGKNIVVIGAGNNGDNLFTTIATFIDSTHVELATTALNTVSKAAVAWWAPSQAASRWETSRFWLMALVCQQTLRWSSLFPKTKLEAKSRILSGVDLMER